MLLPSTLPATSKRVQADHNSNLIDSNTIMAQSQHVSTDSSRRRTGLRSESLRRARTYPTQAVARPPMHGRASRTRMSAMLLWIDTRRSSLRNTPPTLCSWRNQPPDSHAGSAVAGECPARRRVLKNHAGWCAYDGRVLVRSTQSMLTAPHDSQLFSFLALCLGIFSVDLSA